MPRPDHPAHLVETNMSDQPRHSIALNIVVKDG
jgi:hypothetical protein